MSGISLFNNLIKTSSKINFGSKINQVKNLKKNFYKFKIFKILNFVAKNDTKRYLSSKTVKDSVKFYKKKFFFKF